MKALGSPAAVAAAVRDDADASVEKVERDLAAALARLAAEEGAEPGAPVDRDARLAGARRQAREHLAREDLADAREPLEAREAWLRRVLAEGWRRLDEPQPQGARREQLARLAREGLDRVPGDEVEIVVSPADAALVDASWAATLAPPRRARLASDAGLRAGGCLVRSSDGRVAFDNSLEARARRFEAAWRAALGGLYHEGGRGAHP